VRQITQEEKERFLAQMSEDDFREKVVRRLFKRLGLTDGRDLCGPTEHGKDALFFEADALGGRDLVVVQTKKGNLNLASNPSQNLYEAIAQLRTALKADYVCVKDKRRLFPIKVYLAASGIINDSKA